MTHTAQHTPGPWTVDEDMRISHGIMPIAVMCNGMGDKAIIAANAALIACSPELLAALEALLHEPMAERSVDMAKRAIAKAKGGV